MGGIVSSITDGLGLTSSAIEGKTADTAAFEKSLNESSAARVASAKASEEAANTAADVATKLGTTQINAAKNDYDKATAFNKPLLDAQAAAAQTEFAQGKKNLELYDTEGRALQQTLRDDAMGIITPEKQALMDQAAGTAIADARTGTTQQQNMIMRQGARYGFSADKFASMGADAAAANAQLQVAGANAGRVQAGDKFTANVNNAYKTYADLQTSGANLINSGTNATTAAATTNNQTAAQYINGLTAGNNTIQTGQGQRISGLGAVLNSHTSAYGADASARSGVTNTNTNANSSMYNAQSNANAEVMGTIMGAGITKFSDIRLKRNIVKLHNDARGFAWYAYDYVWGGARQIGVMAQELEKVIPLAVTSVGGYKAVNYSLI